MPRSWRAGTSSGSERKTDQRGGAPGAASSEREAHRQRWHRAVGGEEERGSTHCNATARVRRRAVTGKYTKRRDGAPSTVVRDGAAHRETLRRAVAGGQGLGSRPRNVTAPRRRRAATEGDARRETRLCRGGGGEAQEAAAKETHSKAAAPVGRQARSRHLRRRARRRRAYLSDRQGARRNAPGGAREPARGHGGTRTRDVAHKEKATRPAKRDRSVGLSVGSSASIVVRIVAETSAICRSSACHCGKWIGQAEFRCAPVRSVAVRRGLISAH